MNSHLTTLLHRLCQEMNSTLHDYNLCPSGMYTHSLQACGMICSDIVWADCTRHFLIQCLQPEKTLSPSAQLLFRAECCTQVLQHTATHCNTLQHLHAEPVAFAHHSSSLMYWYRVVLSVGSRALDQSCLLYTSPSPRDQRGSRMPSSA